MTITESLKNWWKGFTANRRKWKEAHNKVEDLRWDAYCEGMEQEADRFGKAKAKADTDLKIKKYQDNSNKKMMTIHERKVDVFGLGALPKASTEGDMKWDVMENKWVKN